jgi:thiol:disulfide interchange protein/DsbC/DsbD-like thiol-disulfide interchange protein
MHSSRKMIAVLLMLALGLPALGATSTADAPHVHVQLIVLPQKLIPGQTANAGLYFRLEPGWHIYWKNPGDAGEAPRMRWTLPPGITAGALEFPAPERLPLGPLMDFGYEHEVLFPLTLHVAKTSRVGPAVLRARVSWLACHAMCIPGNVDLEISRDIAATKSQAAPAAAVVALFQRFKAELPAAPPAGFKVAFQPSRTGFRLAVVTGRKETEAVFFPSDSGVIDNPSPQKLIPAAKGFVLEMKRDASLTADPAALNGVLELAGGRAYDIAARPGTVPVGALLLGEVEEMGAPKKAPASAGDEMGMAAQRGSQEATTQNAVLALLRIAGLAFVGGLLLNLMPCVFPVLFLKGLALVRSGKGKQRKLRTHGLIYTVGIVVSFWVLVAALLALRAAGSRLGWGFQFQSPVFLELMAGLLFFLGLSLAGQFEIGLTLTSAGSSLAVKQGYAGSFFTGVLAVVVATPCTAPFMGAAIGYALAQPAAVTFAVFTALALGLAAPYVVLTLQPAWTRWLPKPGAWMDVMKQAVSVPIFATVIWLAWVLANAYGANLLAALLAGFLLLAVAGWILGRWPAQRWATVVAALIVACMVALSVWAPGQLTQPERAHLPRPQGQWEAWSPDAVSHYLSEGRPVLVDFTAKWCLSCQVNERVALDQPEVQHAFAARHVALLKADWTRHDEAITQALTALGRDGVPAYVLYEPGAAKPRLLPEVLTPGMVVEAVRK